MCGLVLLADIACEYSKDDCVSRVRKYDANIAYKVRPRTQPCDILDFSGYSVKVEFRYFYLINWRSLRCNQYDKVGLYIRNIQ